jgi:hypothetical protein
MSKRKMLLVSTALVMLLALLGGAAVMAQGDGSEDAAGYYTKDNEVHSIAAGSDVDVTDLQGITPAELQAMFPMSAEAEAAIVHQVPPGPVVIDGTRYEASEVNLFDGQRLGFAVDTGRVFYAFTTVEGLGRFMQEQYGGPLPQDSSIGGGLRSETLSMFYENW